jgi:hypothetical protein
LDLGERFPAKPKSYENGPVGRFPRNISASALTVPLRSNFKEHDALVSASATEDHRAQKLVRIRAGDIPRRLNFKDQHLILNN